MSDKIASKRRKRTVDAAKMIHSCPQTPDEVSKTDALNGLWNTFVSYADNKDVTLLCSRSRKVNTLVVPKVVNNAVAAFEKSAKNYERSVSVIYRGGILSKRKYNELRSSERFEFDLTTGKRRRTEFKKGCKVPSLVPYKDLMKFVSQQEIGDFEFRFTGEETKKFCHGFMFIIEDVIGDGSDIEQPNNFFALSMARMGLHLRNALSLAVRVSDIKTEDLPKLKEDCRMYFNLASLFHSTNVSVWTMGHCVPFHSNQLMEDLGVGLGINSMQGREAKHQQLASFAEFSLVKNRSSFAYFGELRPRRQIFPIPLWN